MQKSSILIKSIDGTIYKITDLINGIKEPVTEEDIRLYDMHPSSGVLKDIDGNLVDLVDLIGKGGGQVKEVEFIETLPDVPKESVIYINTTDNSIYYFKNGVWVKTSSDVNKESVLSKDSSVTTSQIQEMLLIFNT